MLMGVNHKKTLILNTIRNINTIDDIKLLLKFTRCPNESKFIRNLPLIKSNVINATIREKFLQSELFDHYERSG